MQEQMISEENLLIFLVCSAVSGGADKKRLHSSSEGDRWYESTSTATLYFCSERWISSYSWISILKVRLKQLKNIDSIKKIQENW